MRKIPLLLLELVSVVVYKSNEGKFCLKTLIYSKHSDSGRLKRAYESTQNGPGEFKKQQTVNKTVLRQ